LVNLTDDTNRRLNSTNKRNNPDDKEAVFCKTETRVTSHFKKNAGVQFVTAHTTVKIVRCGDAVVAVV
jgi:hypothetical protein